MKKNKRELLEKTVQHLMYVQTMIGFNPATGVYIPYFMLSEKEQAAFDAIEIAIKIIEKKLRKKK